MADDIRSRQDRRRMKEMKKQPSGSRKKVYKRILIALGVFSLVLLLAGAITVFSIIKDAPEIDPNKLTLANIPEIYDQNDVLFTTLSASENRRSANITEIPAVVQEAFIAVEDVRFRNHPGIDFRRIGGAIKANITGGFGAEGASTITQQVVKNLFLSPEKKITRKLQEQYLAIKLERTYSKDQILEMYLNAIYFSESAYGVVEAADRYFSKSLDELTIEDAALLAGIPQRPNFFNPFVNPDQAQKRRDIVITLMERHGKITYAEAEKAKAVPVESQLNRSEKDTYPYAAFLDQVFKEILEEVDGITAHDIYTGGLKIYTTLDQDAQKITEAILQTDDYVKYPDELLKAGLTVVDTKTGAIKAIGGGRDKETVKRSYNWATDPQRQPGSTIKPILDYGPAIEHLKWSTFHQITDEPYKYSTGVPIKNFNNKFSGDVSMRFALQKSLNIPAFKAFEAVGSERAKTFGRGLGIPLDTMTEAYSLGGFTTGFSSLELAGAYAAFGNEGVYHKPHTVRKIEFPNGKTIDLTPKPYVAMSDYTAYMISDLLKSAVTSGGTGTRAKVDGLPMAGKTGTSNFSEKEIKEHNIKNGAKDIWFAGYTTNYSIAVWTGYDTPKDGYLKYDGHSVYIAQYIFKELMTKLSQGKTTPDFKQPNSVVKVGVEKSTGLLPNEWTPKEDIVHELFVKGTEPTEVTDNLAKAPTPTNLTGVYNEETDQIVLSWSYPEEKIEEYYFELQLAINNQPASVISNSEEMHHIIFNPEDNSNYRFILVAVSKKNETLRSDPVELIIKVPKKEVEEPIIDIPIVPIPTPPDNPQPPDPPEIPDPVDDLDDSEGTGAANP